MAWPKGKSRKSQTVVRKNEDGSVAGVMSARPLAEDKRLMTQAERDRTERQEEVADHEEFKRMEKHAGLLATSDPLSMYLCKRFKVKYLYPVFDYKDSRFPVDTNGFRMSVTRYYPTLGLIFDKLPKNWTPEMVAAKKWAIEFITDGKYQYTWSIEGEKFDGEDGDMSTTHIPEELIWERAEKLKTKPAFEFVYHKPMRVYQFDGRTAVA